MTVEGYPLVVAIPLDTGDTAELLSMLAIGFLFGVYLIYRRNRPSASGSYGNLRFP